jgi:plastocyanin
MKRLANARATTFGEEADQAAHRWHVESVSPVGGVVICRRFRRNGTSGSLGGSLRTPDAGMIQLTDPARNNAMRIKSLLLPVSAAIIVLVVALALGGSRATPSQAHSSAVVMGKTAKVKIHMYSFMPDTLTVRVGTKVTFTNDDQTAHTATALKGAFGTGTINPGKSKTIVLKRVGTYAYHCLFHEFMTGTIKVVS